jgi:uncharacterized protein YdeI (YjbR/CyaY-like superfamily)
MSPKVEPHDVIYFASPDELRDWFEANHESAGELWVGYHKKATGRPSLSWSQAVDEALCVGWIDGVRFSIDEERFAQRFTPRRKGSTWSAINVGKVATLTAAGRMRPAGLAAYEARLPERTAVYSYEQPEAALSDEELERFRSDTTAWSGWEARSPSIRRGAIGWVTSAKRPETRERRLSELMAACREGRLPGPFRVARDT